MAAHSQSNPSLLSKGGCPVPAEAPGWGVEIGPVR